jgi:hypothetical protein
VKSGDSCYEIETYYGTKDVKKNTTICESAGMLSIGEQLKVCGCTAHCSDTPSPSPAPSKLCVNHTIVSGDDCADLASYYGSAVKDIKCLSRTTNGTQAPCPKSWSCTLLWVQDVVSICNCHDHCTDTVPPSPAPAPTPHSATCVNVTVVAGNDCNDLATRYGSDVGDIKCLSRMGPGGKSMDCPADFSCAGVKTGLIYPGDKLQICNCHMHCTDTMPPTPVPPPAPGPAPKDCTKAGSETKCSDLDPKAFCGPASDPKAAWPDGTGCACDWGYIYSATTPHCVKSSIQL